MFFFTMVWMVGREWETQANVCWLKINILSLLLLIISKNDSSLLLVSIVNLVEGLIALRIFNNLFGSILVLSKGVSQPSRKR